MKKNIFAVCDLEVEYALNFMDYLNQKKNIPFEIQAFTTVENLITYGKHTHIELLLISGRAMCKEIRELDIGKVIILSEGVNPPGALPENFLCTYTRTDSCERQSSSVSESGGIFRV